MSNKAKCCFCGRMDDKSNMNFLCGSYSHDKCDSEYFERQEKKIKYLDKNQTDARL